MTTMTHRERVLKALNHEETDRIGIDLGGTPVTSIDLNAYRNLIQYLGFDEDPGIDTDPFHQRLLIAWASEDVLTHFDSDCRALTLGVPEVVPQITVSETEYIDEWGVTWRRPESGHYLDVIQPFKEQEPTLADLENHRWPEPKDPGRLRGVRERAINLHKTDFAVVLTYPYGIVSLCQRLRGFTEWLEDLLINPELAQAFLEYSVQHNSAIVQAILDEVGEYIDVFLFPDDLGFQDRPYMRLNQYQAQVKEYHRRFVEAIKSKTKAKVVLHSDGAVAPLVPDFIDCGIDCLNPIQVSAKGMDSATLQAEYGGDIAFWGGIDTQGILPFGTPDEVRAEVKSRIEDLAPDSGFILSTVHNIQPEVPPENVVALFEAALEYGRY